MPFTLNNYFYVQARFRRQRLNHPGKGDDCINTFYFRNDLLNQGQGYTEAKARLDSFYGFLATGQGTSLKGWMSMSVDLLTYYMRDADAGVGEPGVEIASDLTFPVVAGITALPAEIAVCTSYRANPPYTASRRGRIYLGPFRTTANADGVVAPALRTDIIQASKGLASESPVNPVAWVIASRKNNTAARISQGYVDNAFDVLRGRDPGTEGQYGRRPSDWEVSVT